MSSKNKEKEKNANASENAGIGVAGLQASQIYADNVVFQAERGHGFAAEKANHKVDIFSGKDAKIVGGDNAKNGADRLVDGVSIQTKYCNGGGKCISECFDNGGQFKYLKADGTPMQIEVPSDMYDAAVQSMQEKIRQGRVSGVKDPNKAKDIVRKGNITYEQAKNIAKFGTVEGLTYDATNGIQVAGSTASVSAAVTFALSVWRGEDAGAALEAACYSGLAVGGTAFVTTIATSQIGRTGLEQSLRPASDWMVGQLGPKATKWISNNLSSVYGGANLSGAAAQNHVSKLLRGNVVTAAVTTLVLSSGDFVRLFQGRVSVGQVFKNVASTGASVAGGMGGAAAAGAALGSIIPGPGTAIGFVVGAIGGLVGGALAGKAASAVLDEFIEDDAKQMLEIVNEVFSGLAVDYLLSEEEAKSAINSLEQLDLVEQLRDMYGSNSRKDFAADMLRPLIEDVVRKRPKVTLPTPTEFMAGIKKMVDAAMEEEARERRAILFGKIKNTVKWAAFAGCIAYLVVQYRDYVPATEPPKSQPAQEVVPAPVAPEPQRDQIQTIPEKHAEIVAPPVPETTPPRITSEEVLDLIRGRNYANALTQLKPEMGLEKSADLPGAVKALMDNNANFYSDQLAYELLKQVVSRDTSLLKTSTNFGLLWHSVLYDLQNNDQKFSEITELLISAGVDINERNARGQTITYIISGPKNRLVLYKLGACSNSRDNDLARPCPQ